MGHTLSSASCKVSLASINPLEFYIIMRDLEHVREQDQARRNVRGDPYPMHHRIENLLEHPFNINGYRLSSSLLKLEELLVCLLMVHVARLLSQFKYSIINR